MTSRSPRTSSGSKSNRKTTQLGIEQLETRMMNAVSGIEQNLQLLLQPNVSGSTQLVSATNAAPQVSSQARLTSGTEVRGRTASVSVLGSDDAGETKLTYTWQSVSAPTGATVQFGTNGTNASKNNVLTFNKPGTYSVSVTIRDQSGLATSSTLQFSVAQVLTSISLVTPSGTAIGSNQPLTVTTNKQQVIVRSLDQFGTVMPSTLSTTWAIVSGPSGGTIASAVANGVNTITFSKAGAYVLRAQSGSNTATFTANVVPTLTSILLKDSGNRVVTSSSPVSTTATSQTFSAVGLDQFNVALTQQPSITWSTVTAPSGATPKLLATGNSGAFTFSKIGSYLLQAKAGNITAQVPVSITQVLTTIGLARPDGTAVSSSVPVNATGTSQALKVTGFDQFGQAIASLPALTWSATQVPTGGSATGAVTAGVATLNFTRAGLYSLTVKAGAAVTSFKVNLAQTLTSIAAVGTNNQTLVTTSPIVVTGASQTIVPRALDQFGQALTSQPTFTWTSVSSPTAASATIAPGSAGTSISFNKAGNYTVRVSSGSTLLNIGFNVVQTFTSISVTPGSTSVETAKTQQFTAVARDQFQQPMTLSSSIVWTATGGNISTTGLYTAGSQAGAFAVTARSGTVSTNVAVTVTAALPPSGIRDAALRSLFDTLYVDSSLNRTEMMQILRSAGTDGSVSEQELADLRWLVGSTSSIVMPSYVRELARDVVNDSPANRFYQGVAAGNLAAGSQASLLNKLVDKWFLGADVPAIAGSGLTYQNANGNLFNGTPGRADTKQGSIGDCYFIAAVAAIADRNPDAVRNMFIDNGDGTYTVRFYAGLSTGTGFADYVTVNRRLPTTASGTLGYSGAGQLSSSTSTTLWIALAEKAYAQWNETGNEGRDGTNTYRGIEGGWMSNVNGQVLGYNSTNYGFASTTKQTLINALSTGLSVTLGTKPTATAGGLVGSHAYIITGYNASSDTFSLHNPWGFRHPSALTWDQLVSNCSAFATTNPAGSTAINTAGVRSANSDSLVGGWTTIVTTASGITEASPSDSNPFEQGNIMKTIDNLDNEIGQVASEWVTIDSAAELESEAPEGQAIEALNALAVDLAMSMENLESIFG